jgi:UDP-3-O-acyl-N-acetylglucosamine deacetylase
VFLYQEIQLASSVDQTAIPIFDGSSLKFRLQWKKDEYKNQLSSLIY